MSIHLLSLPAETLDSIVNYLPHPIDALNLSMTCRYFNQHLSTQHNNRFWYTMAANTEAGAACIPRTFIGTGFLTAPLSYEPTRDYKSYVLQALARDGCQFCLRWMQRTTRKNIEDRRLCRVYGFKICMRCLKKHTLTITEFRGLGLDITTNPPKSSVVEIWYSRIKRHIPMTYYWRFDIESLCIAQFGISLEHLKQEKERAKLAREAYKKANPSPQRKLRNQAKSNLAEAAWTIWNGELYRYPRERWAKDVTKEQLLAWMLLRQEDDEPQNANITGTLDRYLKTIRSKATFAEKDHLWYDFVARELLEGLKDRHSAEDGYRGLAFSWHMERITDIRERLPFDERPVMYHCWYEHPDGFISRHELSNLLLHMEVEHPVLYWSSDEWSGLLPTA